MPFELPFASRAGSSKCDQTRILTTYLKCRWNQPSTQFHIIAEKEYLIWKSVVIAGLLGSLFIQRKPIQNGLVHATTVSCSQKLSSLFQARIQ